MASIEERMQILKMIEDGKISASEGADLLRALPRWFRVRVTDVASGRHKVNVNIPMGLVQVGIKMGARFAPDLEGVEYEKIMAAINSGQQGKIMEVMDDEGGERVEIFVE
jgi:hypothetical protein